MSATAALIANLLLSIGSPTDRIVAPEVLSFDFTYSGGSTSYNLTTLPTVLSNPNFSTSKTTVFYFLGLLQNYTTPKNALIRDAYVNSGKYNVITLNFSNFTQYKFYKVESIGNQTAQSIVNLIDAGLGPTAFELAGFSLGAQLTGYIARRIKTLTNNTVVVPKIFALEPAITLSVITGLSKSDAAFVVTMHTSGDLGSVLTNGHVDFFVNYLSQPRCNETVRATEPDCNHQSIQLYWAEAITKGASSFKTNRRLDWFTFVTNNMNPSTPKTPAGLFIVEVNAASPYSKS